MVGQAGEFWLPNRIAGKHVLVVATDPAFEFIARLIGHDLDTVVHAADADAFLCPTIDHFEPSSPLLYSFMLPTSVHVKHDSVGAIKSFFILWPPIQNH